MSGQRVADTARAACLAGPMGKYLRPAFYKAFTSCGFAQDLSGVKTSCAIFARSCLHYAGRHATKPGKIGGGIWGDWLEGLTPWHPSWLWLDGKRALDAQLAPGCVIYRDYARTPGKLGHVQVLVERRGNLWITAEGGGYLDDDKKADLALIKTLSAAERKATDGTLSRLSEPKDIWAKDSLNRIAIGAWNPDQMTDFGAPIALPLESGSGSFTPPTQPAEPNPIMYGHPVKAWQSELADLGFYKGQIDGAFGPMSLAASRELRSRANL